ncbi:hypothetical protein P4H71_22725 [Paenibacillus kribbensis]|uniref:hypothetical protein n=1 Tax=Paenibacillus TaxID=44249 RepID=UPI00024F052E|nr:MULTISPECIES: hypothetical protein [Paenibacillus]EHS56869.1 hypothetical protein WG8_3139 [Paenibacillus sp. Aloe-11]MEC0237141.1 hypothetical protein [Paenibacillus kribbensis]
MKDKFYGVLGAFVVLLVILAIGGKLTVDKTEPPASVQAQPVIQSETPAEPAKPVVEQKEPEFNWATAEVNEENVRHALKDNVGAAMAIPLTDETFRRYGASSDLKGEYIEITVNPGLFLDEKDFVKKAGGSLIAYSKVLFQNPRVYEVSVSTNIDNVGGGENDAVYISWRRDQTKGVDYDKVLDNMFGDYTTPYQLARKYSIQPDIYRKLESFGLPKENNL